MNITQAAKCTELSPHTLRYYEKIGLLLNIAKNKSGHRDYTDADIEWIGFLKKLKATGMSINNMKTFALLRAKGDSSIPERIKLLKQHQKIVEEKLAEIKNNLKNIKDKLVFYSNKEKELAIPKKT
ncbi:MAG: MerR family transcriptional regulator [Gammaproteobacteria bacterium]|jgi:DNA-binding transcriptional MerR regulator